MVRQFVSIALLVLNAIKLTSKKMSISLQHCFFYQLLRCKSLKYNCDINLTINSEIQYFNFGFNTF